MKILFITQFYPPDIQATSQIFQELCEDISKEHEVTVLCGSPLMMAAGENCACSLPQNGPRMIRVPSFSFARKTTLDRILNHVSFALTSFFRLIGGIKADAVLFTSDNPLSFINMVFFRRIPRVYLCQDMYLEQSVAIGAYKSGNIRRALSLFQMACLKTADTVVTIGEGMRTHLERIGIPRSRIEVIHNWADPVMISPCDQDNPFAAEHGLSGKFVVMHSGRIGLTQDLGLLVECAAELREHGDIVFVIAGEGVEKERLMGLCGEKSLDNVRFLPYQPKSRLKYSLGAASAGVILEKRGLEGFLVPSRLYGIMASARPVVAAVDKDSEISAILERSGGGIVIPPGSLPDLKKALLQLRADKGLRDSMGQKGRVYFLENFSRTLATSRYLDVIRRLGT